MFKAFIHGPKYGYYFPFIFKRKKIKNKRENKRAVWGGACCFQIRRRSFLPMFLVYIINCLFLILPQITNIPFCLLINDEQTISVTTNI